MQPSYCRDCDPPDELTALREERERLEEELRWAIDAVTEVRDSEWMGHASTLVFTHGNMEYRGTTLKDIVDRLAAALSNQEAR